MDCQNQYKLFKLNFLSHIFVCHLVIIKGVCWHLVFAAFKVHPTPFARNSVKWFGDLTGHLRDSTLITFTKDCNSTERLSRQKARQQTAQETALVHTEDTKENREYYWESNFSHCKYFISSNVGPCEILSSFNSIHFHLLL